MFPDISSPEREARTTLRLAPVVPPPLPCDVAVVHWGECCPGHTQLLKEIDDALPF